MLDGATFELAKTLSSLHGPVPRGCERRVAIEIFELTLADKSYYKDVPAGIRELARERFIDELATALELVRVSENKWVS